MVWPSYIQRELDAVQAVKTARAAEKTASPIVSPGNAGPPTTAEAIVATPTPSERQIWGGLPPLIAVPETEVQQQEVPEERVASTGGLDPSDRKFYVNDSEALAQWDIEYTEQRAHEEAEQQKVEAAEDRLLVLSEREREHLINPATGGAFTDDGITEGMVNALERRRIKLETQEENLPSHLYGPRMELRSEMADIDAQLTRLTVEPELETNNNEIREPGSEATRIPISETIIDNQFGHTVLFDRGGSGNRYQLINYSDGSQLLIDTEFGIDGAGAGVNFELELFKVGIELGGDFEYIERVGDGNAYVLHPGWEDAVGTRVRAELAVQAYVDGNTAALEALASPEASLEYLRRQVLTDAVWDSSYDDVHDVQTYDFSVDASVGAELIIGLDVNAGVGVHQIVQTDQNSDARVRRLSLSGEAGGDLGLALTGHGVGVEGSVDASLILREDSQGDLDSFDLNLSIAVDGSLSGTNPFSSTQEGLNEFTNLLIEESLDTPIVDVINFEVDSQHADGYELRLTVHVPNNSDAVSHAVQEYLADPSRDNLNNLLEASGGALPTVSAAVYSVDRDVSTTAIGLQAVAGLGIDETNIVEQRTLVDGVVIGPDGVDRVNHN